MEPMEAAEQAPEIQVSALAVSYNRVDALRALLRSVQELEGRETLQTVVVDCGSHDGSGRLDEEFPDAATFLRLPRHFGRTKALNIGIRTAKGEWLLFLPTTVTLHPHALTALRSAMDAEGVGAACATGPHSLVSALPTADQLLAGWQKGIPQLPSGSDYIRNSPVLVRREFLKGMNFFDERYGEYWQDAELFYQLKQAGKRLALVPDLLASQEPETPWTDFPDASGRAALAADYINGVAVYASKRKGGGAGLAVRLKAALGSLGSPKTLLGVIGGGKIDGTQSGL